MPDPKQRTRGGDVAANGRLERTRKGMRRLVVRGETWWWKRASTVRIESPKGDTTNVRITDFTNKDWSTLEDEAEHCGGTPVTPRDVKDWIDRAILGYTDHAGFPKGVLPKGHVEPARKCWRSVEGPRGTWWYRRGECDGRISSPEGVETLHRVFILNGMGMEAWMKAKKAAVEAAGLSFADFGRDRMDRLWNFPVPGMKQPTDAQLETFIKGTLAVRPAEAMVLPTRTTSDDE
jgi:hypothetical protein